MSAEAYHFVQLVTSFVDVSEFGHKRTFLIAVTLEELRKLTVQHVNWVLFCEERIDLLRDEKYAFWLFHRH